MSEQETEPNRGNSSRQLNTEEIQDIFTSNRNIFFEGQSLGPEIVLQRRRMIELFAGNLGLINATMHPDILIDSNPVRTAQIGRVREDILQVSQAYGAEDLSSYFQGPDPVLSHSPGLSGPQSRLLAVDGRRITINELSNESLLLQAFIKATQLDAASIRDLALTVFNLRGQQTDNAMTDGIGESLVDTYRPHVIPRREASPTPIEISEIARRLTEVRTKGEFQLREDQIEAMDGIISGLTKNDDQEAMRRMGIYAATGAGKTRMMREFCRASRAPVLIVVPTQVILEQTLAELDNAEIPAGAYFARDKSTFGESGNQVIVTTYESFALNDFPIKPSQVSAVIFDEAHRILGVRTYKKMIEDFSQCLQLAFTASPDYSTERSIRPLFPPVFERGPREYVEQGILSPFAVWTVQTGLNLNTITTVAGEYSEAELLPLLIDANIGGIAAHLYTEYFGEIPGVREGRQTLAFCAGIAHAEQVALDFQAQGISAEAISGHTPPTEQAEILRRFRSGETKVLCNAELLVTGFDEPKVSLILNLRPTRSIVTGLQRPGRGMRLDPDDPFKFLVIVDFLPDIQHAGKNPPVSYAQAIGTARAEPEEEFVPKPTQRTPHRGGSPEVPSQFIFQDALVITDLEQVMTVTKNYAGMLTGKRESTTVNILAERLGRSASTIREVVEEYARAHPSEVIYLPRFGSSWRDLAPQVVAYVVEKLGGESTTINAVARRLGRSLNFIRSKLREFEQSHPGQQIYRQRSHSRFSHLVPEVVTFLEQFTTEPPLTELPPDSTAMTRMSIAQRLGMRANSIQHYLDELPDELRESFELLEGKNHVKYYVKAEGIITWIKEKLPREFPPYTDTAEYMTATEIARLIGASDHSVVIRRLDRLGHTEQPIPGFRSDKSVRNGKFYHVTPSLIQALKDPHSSARSTN